jgi:hypothetical protein
LGNVTQNSILEIWHGGYAQQIREKILGGIKNIPICKHCDAFHYYEPIASSI